MKPSERVQQRLQQFAAESQGPVGPDVILSTMLQVMDEEYQRSRWLERRLFEFVLTAAAKTGIQVPRDMVLALRDLRGRPRLAVPGGDPLLVELAQVIIGEAQQAAREHQQVPVEPTMKVPRESGTARKT